MSSGDTGMDQDAEAKRRAMIKSGPTVQGAAQERTIGVLEGQQDVQERGARWGTREWSDPLWGISAPGDGGDGRQSDGVASSPADSFRLRVDRVERELSERWSALHLATTLPDRATVAAALEAAGGHAGRAITSLLPESSESVSPSNTRRLAALASDNGIELPVLPEFVALKIGSQQTILEARLQESEDIQRKFMMLYRNEKDQLDFRLFQRFLKDLKIDLTDDEVRHEFEKIDKDNSQSIDIYEFEAWMKGKRKADPRYMSGLKAIGHRAAWAKIKLPNAKPQELQGKPGAAPTRTQKFLLARQKLKPSRVYWLEITGSLLSIYESDEKATDPMARLQLTDKEIQQISVGKRRPEGWGTASVDEQTMLLQAQPEAGNTSPQTPKSPHSPKRNSGRRRSGVAMLMDGLSITNNFVVEIWLQLEPNSNPLRVAIDLIDPDEEGVDGQLEQVWVDSLRAGVAFQSHHRPARALWGSLSKKLKVVVQMNRDFGAGFLAASSNARSVSANYEILLPWHMRHPDSTFSLVWDLMQLVMLVLVCWYVPLRSGFSVEVELWSYAFWQDFVIDLYFLIDLLLQFRTAYYGRSGALVTDSRKIRWHYLRRWFLIDFLCVLPVGYIGYFMSDGNSSGEKLRVVKTLRLLRLGKMLRLAKVFKMLQKYDNVAELKPLISLLTLFFFVFLAAHLLACVWFVIGVEDQIMMIGSDGRVIGEPGSAAVEAVCTPTQVCEHTMVHGWVSAKALEDEWWGRLGLNATLATRYITSMYGVFNALENGFTDNEMTFGIIADQIVGSVIYGGLAAVLSASLIESQQKSKEFNKNYKALKTWMKTRHVKRSHQNQVLAAYSHKFKDSTAFDQEEMLGWLPPDVGNKVIDRLYGGLIRDLPYFRDLDEVIILQLTVATHPLKIEGDTTIMEEGKAAHEMYVLVEGEVVVERQGIELGFLNIPGSFFGEGPVIDPRRHHYR